MTKEWSIPKKDWPPGPWHDEPDELKWVDPETGYSCLLLRGPSGSWCGFVGIPEGHPLYGVAYSEPAKLPFLLVLNLLRINGHAFLYREEAVKGTATPENFLSCHGGITYTSDSRGDDNDGRWWFGFDCAHAFDLMPYHEASFSKKPELRSTEDVYRDLEYAKTECACLAEQLKFIEDAMKGTKP